MKIKSISIVGGLLLLSMGAAAAAPALVTGDLNLRSGPGVNFPVVGVLPGGLTVDVQGCGGGWCSVASAEGSGYASSNFLDMAGGYGGPVYGEAPDYGGAIYAEEPLFIGPGPGFGAWGPGIGLGFGGGWRHHGGWHHRHWR